MFFGHAAVRMHTQLSPRHADGAVLRGDGGRLLARLLAEMHATASASSIRAFDGDVNRAILFMAIARESGILSGLSGGHAVPEGRGQGRAISINALAASMSRPFETVRRHVNALIDDGLCVRTSAGVMVPAAVHSRPDVAAQFRIHHDVLVRLIEDMAWFDMPLPKTRASVRYDWRTGLVAAHDILLTGLEFHAWRFPSWLDLVLVATILCANARPFVYDRDVALRFAEFDAPPLDGMRVPVPASFIARALGLPPSTAQRRVNLLIEGGALVRMRDGVIVSTPAEEDIATIAASRTSNDHTRQIFDRLAAGGFRFDDPARCYLESRPQPTPFH